MCVLIQVGGSGRSCRRCDAKCYDARHEGCDCVCGGRNHGVGYRAALENVAELASLGEAQVLYGVESGSGLSPVELLSVSV